jgi:hypothetical protein
MNGQHISGRLGDASDNPLSNATVRVTATANGGPGFVSTYKLSGTVPASLSTALIQICVNECGSRHQNDMNVYSFQYSDAGSAAPTFLDFSNGLTGWAVQATRTAIVQAVSDETGKSARIMATAEQQTFVNSRQFSVTPGSSYELTITARISPGSVDSGYFALIFLSEKESTRHTSPFTPGVLNLGPAQTDANGRYALDLAGMLPGRLLLEAQYEGNDNYWPAYASNAFVNIAAPAAGAAVSQTNGTARSLSVGYATADVKLPNVPYGTAVFSHSEKGVVVSETAVPPSPPTSAARIFIEYRSDTLNGIKIDTGLAVVNRGIDTANITARLRNSAGQTIAEGHSAVNSWAHRSFFLSQVKEVFPDFTLPVDFPTATQYGTLELQADQPLSVVALRLTVNQRGESLMTTTPMEDSSQGTTNASLYFPQFVDGGGYTTTLILLNSSDRIESGTIRLLDDDGAPFVVGCVGESPNSVFNYSIPPGGIYRLQTDGASALTRVGWAQVTPTAFSSRPSGAGIFSLTQNRVLVTESGIPSAAPSTHARIYVDMSNGHDTGVALATLSPTRATLALSAYQTDGRTPAGTARTLSLAENAHIGRFAGSLVPNLPEGFTGIMDISSETPFVALTLRSLTNARGEFLLTTFPIADATRAAPLPIVFPQIADGDGYATEFILLSTGSALSTKLNLWSEDGLPLAVAP